MSDLLLTGGTPPGTISSVAPAGQTALSLSGGVAPTNLATSAGTAPGVLAAATSTGPPGTAGSQNLFVQRTAPTMLTPGLWVELNVDGTVKTLWVGTNP